jgi:bifunctional DNA-binding transcriptional regulator/antitoxin component of YhaV-PrlF toxin-antitoxin module
MRSNLMEQTRLVRPLRSGQITIPSEFRKQLNITDRTLLQITLVGAELRIRTVKVTDANAHSEWARELYDLFTPIRKEASRFSEKEIDADIDAAVSAVRRKKRARRA